VEAPCSFETSVTDCSVKPLAITQGRSHQPRRPETPRSAPFITILRHCNSELHSLQTFP